MVLDIRSNVTCNLGEIITASISDDYLQLNGLIKTQGNAVLRGVVTPQIGDTVSIQYTRNGVTRPINRSLRVLSSFVDPFERVTTITLGCKLTYLSNLTESIEWGIFDDPVNEDEEPSEIVVFPINASSVMNECLTKLGISATINPLTNKFSVTSFDFSPGYVQVLSDLLVSEGYFGVLNRDELLIVRSLYVTTTTSPLLKAADIIELSDINSGELPGEAVTVSYNSLRLKGPKKEDGKDKDDEKLVDWDYTKETSPKQYWDITCKNPDGNEYNFDFSYAPWMEEKSKYDEWDRLYYKIKTSWNIQVDYASGYFTDFCAQCGIQPSFISRAGSNPYKTEEITTIKYLIPVSKGEKPEEGSDVVVEETTIVKEPPGKVYSGIQFNTKEQGGEILSWNIFGSTGLIQTQKTVTTYSGFKIERPSLKIAKKKKGKKTKFKTIFGAIQKVSPATKIVTKTYKCWAMTSRGQQDMTKRSENGQSLSILLAVATNFVEDGVSIRLVNGRQIGLQQRPSKEQDILDEAEKDPNFGYTTPSEQDLELALGSGNAQRRIEFSMPYAPDDTFYRIFTGSDPDTLESEYIFTSFPSGASSKARNFGRIQNRLLFGNRNGINIQTAPDKIPLMPFMPLTIKANGLSALYMTNGTNWTIDENGIIVSIDALFWQPVSGTGDFWFPTSSNISYLPQDPVPYLLNPTVLGSVNNVFSPLGPF